MYVDICRYLVPVVLAEHVAKFGEGSLWRDVAA